MTTYTKTDWTDEIPDTTPVKYEIVEDVPGDLSSVTIEMDTGVTAGTALNASNLNHMEQGIEDAQDDANAAQAAIDAGIFLTEAPTGNLEATGIKVDLQTGEIFAFGEVGYMKSDGKIWKGDNTVIATAGVEVICVESAGIAANARGDFMTTGIARNDSWAWTVGGMIYLGTNGGMTQTPPTATDTVTQILGKAWHADRINFAPQLVMMEHI